VPLLPTISCVHHQQLRKYPMRFVARAAVGLVLLAAAVPTSAFADDPLNDVMNFYNQKSATKKGRVQSAPAPAAPNSFAARLKNRSAPAYASVSPLATFGGGNPHWINVARQYKGTNPTKRRSLWCADFLNLVLEKSGMPGTNSSMAGSFTSYGRRLSGPQVGAIAVISRGGGAGHVGIVTEIDASGNPVLISGNHNNTVAEATYPRGRVMAYVWPAG
jgi:uncharacterized protein (TIGR02594 family)